MNSIFVLLTNIILSCLGYLITLHAIPKFKYTFLKANLSGCDMGKGSHEKIPEAMGFVCGPIFLIVMFLFIPVPFIQYWTTNTANEFPHHQFVQFVAALLSICFMLALGFADDVLDLRWRIKLLFPTVASLPLLMVYYVTYNGTTVIIPKPVRFIFGNDVWLGPLYYVYMGMLAVFCTNAINIYAGINGIEVGQSFVLCSSIIVYNFIELSGDCGPAHIFSLYFMIPFLGVSLALLRFNWYPASVFVGDTYCYFAGMTFAVVGILGHFSKTMLLFFTPQIINFLFSCPQLFHFVPCPRHRLPKFNKDRNVMEPSTVIFKKSSLSTLGCFCMWVARTFKLVCYKEEFKDNELYCETSNFTIINFMLKVAGPTHEKTLTTYLLSFQVLCSLIAFSIRYGLSIVFYGA
uniref:UDP-N-acetylglucosamine--dolichyl-phosphate N-acetylglucosaminephosphotransferase n=1 Tax=Parasteatoda tepidariorum TaxID=114398 RepID=A0A2L2YJL3_PARTP